MAFSTLWAHYTSLKIHWSEWLGRRLFNLTWPLKRLKIVKYCHWTSFNVTSAAAWHAANVMSVYCLGFYSALYNRTDFMENTAMKLGTLPEGFQIPKPSAHAASQDSITHSKESASFFCIHERTGTCD